MSKPMSYPITGFQQPRIRKKRCFYENASPKVSKKTVHIGSDFGNENTLWLPKPEFRKQANALFNFITLKLYKPINYLTIFNLYIKISILVEFTKKACSQNNAQ